MWWKKKAGWGEKKERGRGLVESDLVLVVSGATTCPPHHLAPNMIVGMFLGGNRNGTCSEILPYMQGGSENFNCPNARSIGNFQPELSHKAQKLTHNKLYKKLKVPND